MYCIGKSSIIEYKYRITNALDYYDKYFATNAYAITSYLWLENERNRFSDE